MKISKYICFILVYLMLSGCVGLSVPTKSIVNTNEINKENVGSYNTELTAIKSVPRNGVFSVSSENEWCGVTVWAVIPIPLQLPVCENKKEIVFVDGKPVKYTETLPNSITLVCGPGYWLASGLTHGSSDDGFCGSMHYRN